MKKIFVIASLALTFAAASAQVVDPNHSSTGGYGHLISQDSKATVWWAEGVYKIMKDAPTPTVVEKTVSLSCAGNEWESFAVVIDPAQEIKGLEFAMKPFKKVGGGKLEGLRSEIRKVEYVKVTVPTDSYGKKGLWPDPMPIFEKEDLAADGLQPYWFSIKLPKDTPAGDYVSTLVIKPLGIKVPVKLHVWDFSLPDSPSMKSMLGFYIDEFVPYDHLKSEAQKKEVFERHMAAFRDFKISPYFPFQLTPMKTVVSGVDWDGGSFDSTQKHGGNYSYRIEDKSMTSLQEGKTRATYAIGGPGNLKISFWTLGAVAGQYMSVRMECYDEDGVIIPLGAKAKTFKVSDQWAQYSFTAGGIPEGAKSFSLHVSPCKRIIDGTSTGKVWIDDISVTGADGKELLPCGNFEPDLDKIDMKVDFSDMVEPAKKYFGEYGFTAFRLRFNGLGGGTYYSRTKGNLEGFDEGTPEYEKLFERYLRDIDKGFCELGIADKACVYWFDEPGDKDYDFVHETNARIKKYAPHINTFITENRAGHDISDVTDYSCTIWNLLNHDKIREMNSKGMETWSYLCCGPHSPWITEFIDHDAINFRMWSIGSYKHDCKGLLIWSTVHWNSPEAALAGTLLNPWEDGLSVTKGYGTEYRQILNWGNGDGRLFYPQNRTPNDGSDETLIGDPIPSIRLQFMRDGIEDYEYFKIYERLKGAKLEIPESLYTNEKTYDKNPADALEFRKKVAEAIEGMKR